MTTDQPRVSVALCTHNGSRFVERQLESILVGELLPTEIVVSDDASTDDTVGIVGAMTGRFASAGVAVVVLENSPALGVVANFERAIRACTGDLVALCDQDDVWHPDRLRVAVEAFGRRPELLLLHSDARLVDAAGTPLGLTLFDGLGISAQERSAIHDGHGFDALMRRNLVTGATAVIRRELAGLAVPFPAPWVHDEWLAVVAAALGGLDFAEEELVDYRQHGANQIGVTKLTPVGKIRRLFEPRDDRNVYLADRARVLLAGLTALGERVPPEVLAKVAAKVRHLDARARLPLPRLLRVVPVVAEAATGRYRLYSRGHLDIARDLLQPAGRPSAS
ncbi:glycosyltransferase involved in cell wall biosynthesis [Conyzicola nivalis]|uniref:Glycosyltransferase involved in cell wall biosynthesis n=1 Tax=Conyzicola nivalis TaxID=1477021 RepID=A0ABV2QRM5_9MICO